MRFTVVCATSAEKELIEIWFETAERQAITIATAEIDDCLGKNPEEAGESRAEGRRILIVPPLAVIYRVKPDDKLVRVLQAWRIGWS